MGRLCGLREDGQMHYVRVPHVHHTFAIADAALNSYQIPGQALLEV